MPETIIESKKKPRSRRTGSAVIVDKLLHLPTMGAVVASLVETDAEAAEIMRDKLSSALGKSTRPALPFPQTAGTGH